MGWGKGGTGMGDGRGAVQPHKASANTPTIINADGGQ